MKLFLILCWAAFATCTYPPPKSWGQQQPPPKNPCQQKPNIDWVRQNADNLVYLEFMKKQAQGDSDWQSVMGSNEYQQRLNELRSMNTGCGTVDTGCLPEAPSCECPSNCDSKYLILREELKNQKKLIQRLYSQILVISQSSGSSSCDCKK
jgi:hypothetical protein